MPTTARVHPTPLYEFIVSAIIAVYLWKLGTRTLGNEAAAGKVFAHYLILSGVARLLIEFIRLNPPVLWGLTSAQCVAALSVAAGFAFLFCRKGGLGEIT